MLNWYVVHTLPRAETRAQWHLGNQGFPTFLPRYLKSRRHARQITKVASPLFPRYLFVQVDCERMPWRSINGTFGVSRLVSDGDLPVPVPAMLIDEIRAREDAAGYIRVGRDLHCKIGDPVRITEGPLCDLVGLFESLSDEERVTLLVNLLGRDVRVEISISAVTCSG